MPTRKHRLLQAEQARYLARAKELQEAGVACSIPNAWQREDGGKALDIGVGHQHENILCQWRGGITACAVRVHLVGLKPNLILEDFSIFTPWDTRLAALQCDSRGYVRAGSGFEFTDEETLNGQIADGLRFNYGDTFEGWVAASGVAAIPASFKNLGMTTLCLKFTDQFGNEYCSEAEAILQRGTAQISQSKPDTLGGLSGLKSASAAAPLLERREDGLLEVI